MEGAMLIRRTRSDDGQIIRALRISALTDAPYAFGAKLEDVLGDSPDKFDDDAFRHSGSDISTSFLAFATAQPVGMIGAFFEQPSRRAFICSLWIQPSYRGGVVGRDLLGSAVTWLVERGANECYAWVADANVRAIKFYKKLGFLNTGTSQALPSNPSELEHLYCHEIAGR